jgi:fatty acid/phospholipid biosynthesis enzyme
MRIAVDAMGADRGHEEIIGGVKSALARHPELRVTVMGPSSTQRRAGEVSPTECAASCAEVISTLELRSLPFERKKTAPCLLDGHGPDREADVLSAADRPLMSARFSLRPHPGVRRRSGAVLPARNGGRTLLIDCGATPTASPNTWCSSGLWERPTCSWCTN